MTMYSNYVNNKNNNNYYKKCMAQCVKYFLYCLTVYK